ncbi:hypothetical protein CT0861_04741 [Colletotrichum tofieldiae]|uniref:Uncharacterized protein n=1 Tax=Colletotrichum tofieldiae TaxID=708197 RepID=A0A166RMX4_9PEZI|nr:hypothetical protein CT0861_04741 [Colletotrichum tofieldiae]
MSEVGQGLVFSAWLTRVFEDLRPTAGLTPVRTTGRDPLCRFRFWKDSGRAIRRSATTGPVPERALDNDDSFRNVPSASFPVYNRSGDFYAGCSQAFDFNADMAAGELFLKWSRTTELELPQRLQKNTSSNMTNVICG